jgi:hypothetical protein
MTLPCPHCGGEYSDRHPCCAAMEAEMEEARRDYEDQCVEDVLRERDERRHNEH